MREIDQQIKMLEQQLYYEQITQDTFDRIKKYLENKKKRVELVENDYKNKKITAEEYNEKLIDIYFEEDRELDNIRLKKNQKKQKLKVVICLIILGVIVIYLVGKEAYKTIIASNNTEIVASLEPIAEPIQKKADLEDFTMDAGGFQARIDPLAKYSITGVVLNMVDHKYRFMDDVYSRLSPVDIHMAWGMVSENKDKVSVTASSSRVDEFIFLDTDLYDKVDREKFNEQHSNNHLIPANDDIRTRLRSVRKGDYIRMEGYLVGVYSEKAEPWISSLERGDSHQLTDLQRGLGDTTRDNACEIIYVTDLKWLSL